jgi:hypothetical protein
MEFLGEIFMVYDTNTHQLNLGKFLNVKFKIKFH